MKYFILYALKPPNSASLQCSESLQNSMIFERMVEECLHNRGLFNDMDEDQRRELLNKVMDEAENQEEFGRILFNINLLVNVRTRKRLYYQFAVALARYFYSIQRLELIDRNVSVLLESIKKLTKKKLEEQEKAEEDVDRWNKRFWSIVQMIKSCCALDDLDI